jgi:SAM-dependent methyltransferase
LKSPTSRFSDRVADYVKYRPSYPRDAIDAIVREAHIDEGARIADIGSGTGISARLLLERGYEVVGVEPNAEMRAAAEEGLAAFPRFRSVDGTAERTGLEDSSVSLAVAAQAFHWFRRDEAKSELERIVRAPHRVALMWNERLTDTPFLEAYEDTLHRLATDYAEVNHANIDRAAIGAFFARYQTFAFPNVQRFDRDGFIGRARSSSYVPKDSKAMMDALEALFERHALGGWVEFRYVTSVHVGTL